MGNCRDCKHWERGLIQEHHPEATDWKGEPHWKAGKTDVDGRWWIDKNQDSGECTIATSPENKLFQAECLSEGIAGNLFTAADFGCPLFEPAPEGWDHWRRWYWGPGKGMRSE
jgi:hypothetical protein